MDLGGWSSELPLLVVFVLTMMLCVVSVKAGTTLAKVVLRKPKEKEAEGPLGSMVGAVLGLLAFILAFTFGMTAARFDSR